ncbi:MAG: hypothetical protein RL186_62 [Pseudomonadota bacterium]
MKNNFAILGTIAIGAALGGAALTPAIAQAQAAETVNLVDSIQTQTGDVTARVTITGGKITVDYSKLPPGTIPLPPEVTASNITSISTAIGNSFSAKVQNNLKLKGNVVQNISGNVGAYNTVTTESAVPGEVAILSSAYGNTAQGEACCGGIDMNVTQNITGGSVHADAEVTTAPGLGTLTMSASATGNAIGASVTNGPIDLKAHQSNAGTISANAKGTVCCNNNKITVGSSAVANSAISGSENSVVFSDVTQSNSGHVSANSSHNTGSGTEIVSAAQATGNSIYTTNKWAYTQSAGTQHNSGKITATAHLTANNYKKSATVGVAATGNSILLSSQGSSGGVYGYQNNEVGGDVLSDGFLDGASNSGGVAQISSSAIGNAITGYACASCGTGEVKLEGGTEQINAANTTANVTVGSVAHVGTYGNIIAQASAVGNSATFIAQRAN